MPVIELETVTTADFLEVIAHTKPSARCLMDRYSAWEKEYESVWHIIIATKQMFLLQYYLVFFYNEMLCFVTSLTVYLTF